MLSFNFFQLRFFRDPTDTPFTPKRDAIVAIVERRWKWIHRPIHGMAALLHPAYKGPLLHSDEELSSDRDMYLKFIMDGAIEEQGLFLLEIIKYHNQGSAVFTSPICLSRDSMVKPLFWWESFGYQMPHVQKVALRVLSQVRIKHGDVTCLMPFSLNFVLTLVS